MITLTTFCFAAIFALVSKNHANAFSNRNDYELLKDGFKSSDVNGDNVLYYILQQSSLPSSAIENEQTGEIIPFLPSEYLNKDTLNLLLDDVLKLPKSGDHIVSTNAFKSVNIQENATPTLLRLLRLIDQIKLFEYRHVLTKDAKRGWNTNGAFDTLVNAVGRLGRLDDKESKSGIRRFYSWGG